MVYGTLHDDHDDHLHYHLMISANAVGDSKRNRMTKAQFGRVKKDLEMQELKGRPLYGKSEFALFQTKAHGGIKTYQWTNIPLALSGRVDKRDGTTVQIEIGLKDDDPIFMIPDLSPHTSSKQRDRSARNLIKQEELDPIVAHGPHGDAGKFSAEDYVYRFLKSKYDIDPADLVSAELSLVPVFKPRDVGFDRRLMAIYGQDDRLSAYASIQAVIGMETPDQTAVIFLADNEETGSNNNTSAGSSYIHDLISEIIYAQEGDTFRQPMQTMAYRKSLALSIDVNPGINPMSPGVWEAGNAPKLGYGINIKLYGRGFNANSEYIAWVRNALDQAGVPWQTATYMAPSGGQTLGHKLSAANIDTIDFGVPLHSIHTPYAVSDKSDVMALKDGIRAFLLHARSP